MNELSYDIVGVWDARRLSPEDLGRRFLFTLDAMSAADPALSHWGAFDFEGDTRIGFSLETIRADFAEFIERHPITSYDGEPNGYAVWMLSGYAPDMAPGGRTAGYGVTSGGPRRDDYEFRIGDYFDPIDLTLVTYARYEFVFRALAGAWSPAWARLPCNVRGKYPADVSGDPTFPYSGFQMPWMAYLSADRADPVKPPPQVITERTTDGGLIMIAAETRLIPGDPAHMKASRAIAEIMIEHSGEPQY